MVDVKGKWAFITGASRGIGGLAAKFMAEHGCNLILHSRSIEHTEKIMGEVRAMGVEAYAVQAGYSASKAALDKITIDLGSTVEGTDVMINLTDPGWCRTDLGGPNAPNAPESAIPGIVVGVFVDDKKSGRYLNASYFEGMTLEEAVKKAETFDSPYGK